MSAARTVIFETVHIRAGAFSFDQLAAEAARLESALAAAEGATRLPASPEEAAVNGLCADLVAAVLEGRA